MHHLCLKNKLFFSRNKWKCLSFGSPEADPQTRMWMWEFIWEVNLRNMSRDQGRETGKGRTSIKNALSVKLPRWAAGKSVLQCKTRASKFTHQGQRGWGVNPLTPVGHWLKSALRRSFHESCTDRASSGACGKPQAQGWDSSHGHGRWRVWH